MNYDLFPQDWQIAPISELVKEVDVRVKDLPRDEWSTLEVLSLTKNYGLILQLERFDKRVATENVEKYKVVKRGWIVYNPYVIWEGAIHALHKFKQGIVSPVYVVWQRKEDDGGYLDYLLRTESLIEAYEKLSHGAVNRRRAIKREDFLSIKIPLPPLEEQRRIARVLNTVRNAIAQQERLIALVGELKSALLRKLFTEGLRGEKQKQTEIGLVPESWEVVPLGELIDGTPKNGMYKPQELYGSGVLILRINDFGNDGDVIISASNRVRANDDEIATYVLQEGDLVTNRVNSLSHLGKTALVGTLSEPIVFESNMMKYRINPDKALPGYVFRLLNSPVGKNQVVASAKRAVAQSSINQGSLKAILLPVPNLEVQEQVVSIIETVVRKIELHQRMKRALEELFRTLLHQLMTAQIRVNELDI